MKAAYYLQWYTHFEKIYINPSIKSQLRKLLAKEDVQNKDRMAIEPIIRLTSPDVLKVLWETKQKVDTRFDSRQIQAGW